MVQGKHTPGPWEKVGDFVIGSHGLPVAEISPQPREEVGAGKASANARLIAAAPALLEALEAQFRTDPKRADYLPPKERERLGQEAIAQARGES